MLIKALNANNNKSKTGSRNDISRSQLLIRKGGMGKSCILDIVITTLKNKNYSNKAF